MNTKHNYEVYEVADGASCPKSPPDKTAPTWARWKARDADGTWHWFECRPRCNRRIGTWSACRGESERAR